MQVGTFLWPFDHENDGQPFDFGILPEKGHPLGIGEMGTEPISNGCGGWELRYAIRRTDQSFIGTEAVRKQRAQSTAMGGYGSNTLSLSK